MFIVAIDAGRGYSAVSRSVTIAARAAEQAGAMVHRISLADYRIRTCTGCKLCVTGEGCKIPDDLPYLISLIARADGVILGAPSSGKSNRRTMDAMLSRLATYFQDTSQPTLPGMHNVAQTPVARAAKRALIITAAESRSPIATFFGPKMGNVSVLRKTLSHSGIEPIGSVCVEEKLVEGKIGELYRSQAMSLGRILAGKI